MNPVALVVLNIITGLFFILENSFESFTRISLSRLLKSMKKKGERHLHSIERYDLIFHSLKVFSFFLQMLLFIGCNEFLKSTIPNAYLRAALILTYFLIFFHLLLYYVSYLNKEFLLRNLSVLLPIPWYGFYPINKIFSLFIKDSASEDKITETDNVGEKELEVFFEEGEKEGVLEKEDQEMIVSILEFGDTLVKEVMTPRADMSYTDIRTPLNELIRLIKEKKRSRIPVVSGRIDNVEGIILSKDVFNYWNKKDFNIRDIIRPTLLVPETMRILELLKEMQKTKQKFAMVIDEFGGVSGVVTMEDIVEEIVGDIKDEYDDDVAQITREKDYFIAMGDTDIYELTDTINITIDENEDYQTVAGLISFKLGKIPQPADKVAIDGYIFEVLEIVKNRITKVKIYRDR